MSKEQRDRMEFEARQNALKTANDVADAIDAQRRVNEAVAIAALIKEQDRLNEEAAKLAEAQRRAVDMNKPVDDQKSSHRLVHWDY